MSHRPDSSISQSHSTCVRCSPYDYDYDCVTSTAALHVEVQLNFAIEFLRGSAERRAALRGEKLLRSLLEIVAWNMTGLKRETARSLPDDVPVTSAQHYHETFTSRDNMTASFAPSLSVSMLYCRCRPNDPGVQTSDATKFAFQHSNICRKPSSFRRTFVTSLYGRRLTLTSSDVGWTLLIIIN